MTSDSFSASRSFSDNSDDDNSFDITEGAAFAFALDLCLFFILVFRRLHSVLCPHIYTSGVTAEAEVELVEATNDLLREIGAFPKLIQSFEELTKVASSMFVAIFENIFQVRLEGIARVPQTYPDYVGNVQRVIDELSRCAGVDLSHISGESIVDGDRVAIQNLVRVFWRVLSVTKERSSHLSVHDSGQSQFSSDASRTSRHAYEPPLWQLQLRRQAVDDKAQRARARKATMQKHNTQRRSLHSAKHARTVTAVCVTTARFELFE